MKIAGLLLALATVARASQPELSGYKPSTEVTMHSRIDLDQQEMETALAREVSTVDTTPDPDYTTATAKYASGGNSIKGSGATRTLKGFSTGLFGKAGPSADNEKMFNKYNTYWNNYPHDLSAAVANPSTTASDYGNKIVSDALAGAVGGAFTYLADIARVEIIKKSTVYTVSWIYVVHELEDAVKDCVAGDILNNDLNPSGSAPSAWDEGWAFYAGSLGTKMTYTLAQKRCKDYGVCKCDSASDGYTCGTAGLAKVNNELLKLYDRGHDLLTLGRCNEVVQVVRDIEKQMTIPLVQLMMKYTYKLGYERTDSAPEKASGEGYAGMASVIAQIHSCNPVIGVSTRAAVELADPDAVTHGVSGGKVLPAYAWADSANGWATWKSNVEATYECLGITCADVGGYVATKDVNTGVVTSYKAGFEPCVDGEGATKATALAMYTFCPAGEWKQTTGTTTVCTKCAAGYASARVGVGFGSTLQEDPCTACSPGYYATGEGNTLCTICPANTYSGEGAAACTACNGETYAAGVVVATGGTACVPDEKKKKDKPTVVETVVVPLVVAVACLMALVAAGLGIYSMSLKANYDQLKAEKSRIGGARV